MKPGIGVGEWLKRAEERGLPRFWTRVVVGAALLVLLVTQGAESIGLWHWMVVLILWDVLAEEPGPIPERRRVKVWRWVKCRVAVWRATRAAAAERAGRMPGVPGRRPVRRSAGREGGSAQREGGTTAVAGR